MTKLHYSTLRFFRNPGSRRGLNVALVAHDGERGHIRALGLGNGSPIDLGIFRARAPEFASSAWVFAEWVESLRALAEETWIRWSHFRMKIEAAREPRGHFRLSRVRRQEMPEEANSALVVDKLFDRLVKNQTDWRPMPFQQEIGRFINSAEFSGVSGFLQAVELETLRDDGEVDHKLFFDAFIDGRQRLGLLAVDAWQPRKAVRRSLEAANRTIAWSIRSGLLQPERCFLLLDTMKCNERALLEVAEEQIGRANVLNLSDANAPQVLREVIYRSRH